MALAVGLATGWWSVAGAQNTARQASPQPAPSVSPAASAVTRYALVEVAGNRLPAETEKGVRCREEVTAGTLSLSGDGRWVLETATREMCGDRTEDDRDTDDGTYRAEGSTFRFLDDDGRENTDDWGLEREIDLDDLRTGTLAQDGTLSIRLAGDKHTLVFRRQAD